MEAARPPETFVPVVTSTIVMKEAASSFEMAGSYTNLHDVILHDDSNLCLHLGNFVTLEKETTLRNIALHILVFSPSFNGFHDVQHSSNILDITHHFGTTPTRYKCQR
jgi:hypothetical protein